MSDPAATPPTPTPPPAGPAPPPNRGLGWFLTISGAIVVVLTLGCVIAVSDGHSDDFAMGLVCGSPTFALGGLFLWLGTRRLKR